ncbi:MAG: PAS domain S-box protein [Bacteroidales bacterium]|nr:PAS domain S-box protein [Bacteroidales bacterium]
MGEKENRLRYFEEKYLKIFNTSPNIVALLNYQTRQYVEVNHAFYKILGYTPEEVQGKSSKNFLKFGEKKLFKTLRYLKENGSIINYETIVYNKTGDPVYIQLSVYAIEISGEKYYLSIAVDIGDSKRAEEGLRKSEEKFKRLADHSPEIVYSFSKSKGISYHSGRVFDILGYTTEQLNEDPMLWLNKIHPEDMPRVKKALEGIDEGRLVDLEYRIQTADGRWRWMHDRTMYVYRENNDVILEGLALDITERKQREEALIEKEKRIIKQREAITKIIFDTDVIAVKIPDAFHCITRIASESIEVNRASIWKLNDGGSELHCVSLYDAAKKIHTDNIILKTCDFPEYFNAIKSEGLINAPHAQTDHRTMGLTLGYLKPLDITSMLDVAVLIEGKLSGVLCLEHNGYIREWHTDEVSFATTLASLTTQVCVNEERIKSQKQLLVTKQSYINIFNTIIEAIYILDFSYNFIEVNKGAEIMYQLSREELIGKNPSLVAAPGLNKMDVILAQLAQVLHTGIPTRFEFWAVRKNGEIFPKDVIVSKGKYFDKTVLIATARDISEDKKADERLRENEANLKAIIENSLESIWSVNTNYEIQYVNDVFAKSFYETFGVHLTRNVNIVESLPDSLKPLWKERYDRTFNNEHSVFEDKIVIEDKCIYIEVSMNPIVLNDKVVGASFYGKDITEKKLAEIQLQYQADLRKILVELSSHFINLPLKEINPAINNSLFKIGDFIGADRAYIVDYDFNNQTANCNYEWNQENIEPFKNKMKNVPLVTFSNWVDMHKKGEKVYIKNVYNLSDNNLRQLMELQSVKSVLTLPMKKLGNCIGFVGFETVRELHNFSDFEQQLLDLYTKMIVNIYERLENERELLIAKEKAEENDRLKTAFINNISHEIRTPLNGIMGFGNLMTHSNLSENERLEYYKILKNSSDRLIQTVTNYMDISMISSGSMKVHLSEFHLNTFMIDLLRYAELICASKDIKINCECPEMDLNQTLVSDKELLRKALEHLLNNAEKFTLQGQISFGYILRNGNIEFFINDTGIGIVPEKLTSIFDAFIQEDHSLSRSHEGSGLGLAIANGIVKLLKGNLQVKSEKGVGSQFMLSIPFKGKTSNEMEEKNKTLSKQFRDKPLILIAEDIETNYFYLNYILKRAGYDTLHALNGAIAVDLCRQHEDISLVLMDIKMPVMNGIEATQCIRKFRKDLHIIAVTAYAKSSEEFMIREAGCAEVIAKPFQKDDLLRVISNFL